MKDSFEPELAQWQAAQRMRVRRQVAPAVAPAELGPDDEALRGTTYLIDGQQRLSFGSNDYLGLSQHPALIAAAHAAIDR